MSTTTASITDTATGFFEACETGKGWETCSALYVHVNVQTQSEPLAEITTLKDYVDWMKGLLVFVPDGRYESAVRHRPRTWQRLRLRCLLRHAQRRRRPNAANRQGNPHRLRLRDGLRRRQVAT